MEELSTLEKYKHIKQFVVKKLRDKQFVLVNQKYKFNYGVPTELKNRVVVPVHVSKELIDVVLTDDGVVFSGGQIHIDDFFHDYSLFDFPLQSHYIRNAVSDGKHWVERIDVFGLGLNIEDVSEDDVVVINELYDSIFRPVQKRPKNKKIIYKRPFLNLYVVI